MFNSFLISLLYLGIPILVMSYLLISLIIRSGELEAFANQKEFDENFKKLKEKNKSDKKNKRNKIKNLVAQKWFTFGGCFYGTMALFTFFIIEFDEIVSFFSSIANLDSIQQFLSNIGVQLLVDFLVNSIMNFVAAIMWFKTLPELMSIDFPWLWLGVAYAAYRLGILLAQKYNSLNDMLNAIKAIQQKDKV